jgi:hypothetical protein
MAITWRGLNALGVSLRDSDLREAFETARAAQALAARLGDRPAHVFSLWNATHDAMETGDWDWAEGENRAGMESPPGEVERAELTISRLMIGSLRGEDLAEEARWLERVLGGAHEKSWREELLEARFWVAFGTGRLSDAYDAATAHGQVHADEASQVLPNAAICALWDRDRERSIAALAALDLAVARGPVVDMHRRTILAGLAALEGRPEEALSAFREALAGWRDLRSPWREALTAITMATLLDPADPEVRAAAEAAREILVRLRAAPFVARLDAALAGGGEGR